MRRRRQYFLKDTLQFRLVAVSFVYQLLILLVFAGAIFVPVGLQLEGPILSSSQFQEAAAQFLVLHRRVWPPLIITLVLLTLHSVFFSHRIAGPLYRFHTVYKAVARGELTVRTGIRKRDFLQKEADALREMVDALRAKIGDVQASSGEVAAILTELERAATSGSTEDLRQAIETLHKRVENLTATIGRFKTCSRKPAGSGA